MQYLTLKANEGHGTGQNKRYHYWNIPDLRWFWGF
jgi:hypothetical protein